MRLEALLGRSPTGEAEPTGWPEVPTPPRPDPAALPEVVAAGLDTRAALARATAARLALVPDLVVFGGVADHAGQPGTIWGATIEVPLFAPRVGDVREAAARHDLASAEADRTRLELTVTAIDAARALEDARAMSAAYAGVDLAGALTASASAWEAGEVSLPDWLARRNAILASLDGSIDARFDLERARLALWELSGQLPPEFGP